MFDYYEPDPPLACPVCGTELAMWQGYDGPCGLMVWRQGFPSPVDQPIDDDARLTADELARHRLPGTFTIRAKCCSPKFTVEAIGRTSNGTWSSTEVVTAQTARQHKNERRSEFKARLAWLRGVAV
jgi:hypothetical protein